MPTPSALRAALYARLGDEHGETLFDFLADVQFWIKDAAGRYVRVNRGLLLNYGFPDEGAIVGRTDRDLFPPHLAEQYQRDDRVVLRGGEIRGRLELVARPDHSTGWHLTDKIPLRDRAGRVVATAGITRDLDARTAADVSVEVRELAPVVDRIRARYMDGLDKAGLARLLGVSARSLERRFRAAFAMPLSQYQSKLRMHQACHLLTATARSITDIALSVGYADHSHFTREFGRRFGIAPRRYRQRWAHRAAWTVAAAALPESGDRAGTAPVGRRNQ